MHPGCGIQLAWKFAREAGIQPTATAPGTCRHFLEGSGLTKLPDPAAAGGIVFVDAESLRPVVNSLMAAASNKRSAAAEGAEGGAGGGYDVLCICANSAGRPLFARHVGMMAYAATASIAFPDDLLTKLQKAAAMQGIRLIEINAPCSHEWRSDSSNTVEIARQMTEIGMWPLFEMTRGKFHLSYKPLKLGPLEPFLALQKKVVPDKLVLDRAWHSYLMARPFEAEI